MAERFTKKDLWDNAGKAGLVLGAISIVYLLTDLLLSQDAVQKLGTFPLSIISFLLWAAKFAGCILLMRFFMQRFAGRYDGVTRRDVSRYGTAIALTSALLYSAFILAWSKFIDPEMFTRAYEQFSGQYASLMDSNMTAAMEQVLDKMPVYAFFTNFIYCFLFGSILSSILSNRIGQDIDPFAGGNNPFSNDNQ